MAPASQPLTTTPDQRLVYLETVGCQMNVLDSELVLGALRAQGYQTTADIARADAILFNTCSVRQHAEDKIYSALGRLKHAKRRRPDLVIGVLGCMAQKDQDKIFERAPHVDFICSPGQLAQVPNLIDQSLKERGRHSALGMARNEGTRLEILQSFESYDPLRDPSMRPTNFQAFVRLMMGCDKFCTYCIVPTVRGPEQGRHPQAIEDETRRLVAEGCKEITFLGQTVNSYQFVEPDGRRSRLSDLLYRVHDLEGLSRIKFVTNYPRDMTDDLLDAVRDLPKVSPYLHVPAQSGCDKVLAAMKRGYSAGQYREMLSRIRERVPDATISSDFIVGFPGEDEASFERTVDLLTEARFKNAFIFKYSPREGTKAFPIPETVSEEEKRRRNNVLLKLQESISLEEHQAMVGRTLEVLVEGPSKSALKGDDHVHQMMGRSHADHIVVFDGTHRQAGRLLPVRIADTTPFTLIGEVVTHELVSLG